MTDLQDTFVANLENILYGEIQLYRIFENIMVEGYTEATKFAIANAAKQKRVTDPVIEQTKEKYRLFIEHKPDTMFKGKLVFIELSKGTSGRFLILSTDLLKRTPEFKDIFFGTKNDL
jgi:hypothetical protein